MYTWLNGKRIRQNEKNACLFNSYEVRENALVQPLSGFHFLYAFILRFHAMQWLAAFFLLPNQNGLYSVF